ARAGTCHISTHYVFGGQRVAVHEQTPTSDAVYWLHGDHLGSASLVTDQNGKKVSELRYKPYGETRYSLATRIRSGGLPRSVRRRSGWGRCTTMGRGFIG
ncbi:MAG: hypothetical protein HC853_04390, partial [Anaerolineae bacterium]|nr:hypothetical protein [Anaerolineae bacterium]